MSEGFETLALFTFRCAATDQVLSMIFLTKFLFRSRFLAPAQLGTLVLPGATSTRPQQLIFLAFAAGGWIRGLLVFLSDALIWCVTSPWSLLTVFRLCSAR